MGKKNSRKPRVLMALSGGVDSSVSAALLVKAGYDVTGAYMKQWSDGAELSGVCSWKTDRRDALRVAAHLGIPLLTLDFEKEYKENVLEYMFREYTLSRTPNPDVMCNATIKFGVWLKKAKALGFDFLATGHYAKVGRKISVSGKKKQVCFSLLQAKDSVKDQTYFLHQLSQTQLASTLFPIGGYTKIQVRALAKKLNLPTALRAESMGICFVGEVPMAEFLAKRIPPTPGKMVTSSGKMLGEHTGLPFYTIGQRHVGISSKGEAGVDPKPLYVVAKRRDTNELVLGYEDDPLLYTKEVMIEQPHWILGEEPSFPLQCSVRFRHRQALVPATVLEKNGQWVVRLKKAERAITPGQFAVFYKNEVCLGGSVVF